MARGLLAGAVCGALVSVGGAAALSLYVGLPSETPGPMVTETPPDTSVRETVDAGSTIPQDPEPAAEMAAAPTDAPEPEAELPRVAMPEEAVLPDNPPLRFEDTAEAPAVTEAPAAPALRPAEENPVDVTGVAALDAPAGVEADPAAADTTSAAMPEVDQGTAALDTPQAPDQAGEVAVTSNSPVLPTVQAVVPAAPRPEAEPNVTTQPAQPPVPQVPQEESGLVVAGADAEGAPRLPVIHPEPEPAPPPQETAAAPEPAGETQRPAIGTPGVSLLDRDGQASRLPSVGSDAETFVPAARPDTPLARYAVDRAAPTDLPLMAIVLLDDPDSPLGPEAFDDFPFPLTFAIDPSSAGAAARMKGYRDQGFEVVVIGAVPVGATASDVEVALGASFSTVPEAVALIEAPTGGLQASRQVSDQVTQVVRDSGHGLVLMPNGLNTAQALAERDGVAAATVFRDFDGEGQDARTIRRFLDGAAFRARQNGNVIMLGRLRADTISALLLWGLQDRAAQVALVPVSMVLTAEGTAQ